MWYNYPNQRAKKFLSLSFLSVIVAVWGHTSFEKAQSRKVMSIPLRSNMPSSPVAFSRA